MQTQILTDLQLTVNQMLHFTSHNVLLVQNQQTLIAHIQTTAQWL